MLPTASAERPATRSRCATSAVVVVLPFVPVIAMIRVPPPPPPHEAASARKPRSISERIGTRAALAASPAHRPRRGDPMRRSRTRERPPARAIASPPHRSSPTPPRPPCLAATRPRSSHLQRGERDRGAQHPQDIESHHHLWLG